MPLAEKHPYSPGGAGAITAAIRQFRNALPPKITAETLKKFAIAPNNESYIINILRFLDVIDADGNRTDKASSAFSKGDEEFQKEFGEMIRDSYGELFTHYNEDAWELPDGKLVAFFRTTDQTSNITGKRQANTFQTLAGIAGHGQAPPSPKPKQPRDPKPKQGKTEKTGAAYTAEDRSEARHADRNGAFRDVGLTVRIEVNLPQAADQETYDRIFRSIRENLLNAK
jgi:hypothetical protein